MSFFKVQNSDSEKLSLQILKSQNARLEQQNDWLQKTVERLTDQILAMKKEGFAWTPPFEQPKRPQMDDRILAAIRARAKEGSPLEATLFEHAESRLTLNGEIEDIVDEILAGADID